jgi:RNA polymerase sigma-70 factor (ECF subfamily)
VPDPGPSPFEIALDHETQELIESVLADVPECYRTVVVLREVEGLAYDEITVILGISLGTVKSRLARGRECLRRALAARLSPPDRVQLPLRTRSI